MLSEQEKHNLEIAHRYIEFVSTKSSEPEDLKNFLDESVVWQEMPNLFAPSGRTSDYAKTLSSFGKGWEYLPEQTYILREAIASGNTVALEITWVGVVTKSIGPFSAGSQLSARIAIFLRFRDGRIINQTDYPCYDPVSSV